jgi:Flp pilus assembly protein TadG
MRWKGLFMLKRFSRDVRGNVAMMFGLCMLGVFGLSGLAVDYSRQQSTNTKMQAAADNVALTLARLARTKSAQYIQNRADELYAAALAGSNISGSSVTVTLVPGEVPRLNVVATGKITSMYRGIFGVSDINVNARASVPVIVPSLEIALVLDNTGSMNSSGKIDQLKAAATSLISTLMSSSSQYATEARISIVPFDTSVNIGKTNSSASWIDWSGYGGNQASWSGCVADRNQPHDVENSLPTGDAFTWYPATDCGVSEITPLTSSLNTMNGKIQSMSAAGATNLTIGVNWGHAMLTPGGTLSTASVNKKYLTRYMIVLTDGVNSQNRWTGDAVQIDARARQACTNAKTAGIKIYTIRVIDGNEALLRECASNEGMYYNITNASELTPVFEAIAKKMATSIYLGT